MHHKPIAVANASGTILGTVADILSVLPDGHYRCASSVFVFNNRGQILIQKRSQQVLSPGLFDKSVGGHVDSGETHETAAAREVEEELGLHEVVLKEVVSRYIHEGYVVSVYTTSVPEGQQVTCDTREIESVTWLYPEEIDTLIRTKSELCTQNFVDIWSTYRDILVTP